jgi:mannitol/fructose-specific phosphotransferase system IIA component
MENILEPKNIILNEASIPYEDVIRRCGEMLIESGYVKPRYLEGMLARDRNFSTAIGNFLAIPHGEKEYKDDILKTGIVVITYPDGIDWNGEKVHLAIGIAARGDEHLTILENIVDQLETGDDVLNLVKEGDKQAIHRLFTGADA